MKYGVIVCPKCKQVKGVNLNYKSSKCFKCGKILVLEKVRILYKTNSEKDLRKAIGLVNAQLEGKEDSFKEMFDKKFY